MQSLDIVKHLESELPKHTSLFNSVDNINIVSLTQTLGVATLTTTVDHNLITGDFVTIHNVNIAINVVNITRENDIVTVTTAIEHNLGDPSLYSPEEANKLIVTIQDVSPTEYNGTYKLRSVINETTFTYRIDATPTSPATTFGQLIAKDVYNNYNGTKQVTVLSTTSFQYNVNSNSLDAIGGSIQCGLNVVNTPLDNIPQVYKENVSISRETQNWLYVTLLDGSASKDGISASDESIKQESSQSYYYDYDVSFVVHAVLPAKNEKVAGSVMDLAKNDILIALIKCLAKFTPNGALHCGDTDGTTFINNSTVSLDASKPYFVESYTFSTRLRITDNDVFNESALYPLKKIDVMYEDKDIDDVAVYF